MQILVNYFSYNNNKLLKQITYISKWLSKLVFCNLPSRKKGPFTPASNIILGNTGSMSNILYNILFHYFRKGCAHQPNGSGGVFVVTARGCLRARTRGSWASSWPTGHNSGGRSSGGRLRNPRRKAPATLQKLQRTRTKEIATAEWRRSEAQGGGVT